jgi:gliding motility-associated-like protein
MRILTTQYFSGILLLYLFLFQGIQSVAAQGVVNNGSFIVVEPGAYLVIADNYLNRNDGLSDGKLDLDGTLILGRNWVNTANNNVITDIGISPMGNVIMNGSIVQNIEGTNPTHFENLTLQYSDKVLRVSDCEVNGRLTLDAVLDLNAHKLIVDNPSTDAITYVSKYILSETTPDDGYGEVQWNIGDKTLTYQVPFGTGTTDYNDLNLMVSTTQAGDAGGALSFATYYSGCQNVPIPFFVNALDRSSEFIADRYWIIRPRYQVAKPGIDIVFKYTDRDIESSCNSVIVESQLKAIRYSTLLNTWSDMPASGIDDPANNQLSVSNVAPGDLWEPWALVQETIDWDMFLPNAFTPNADGLNDGFGPVGYNFENFQAYEFMIYDRWGEKIFETSDPTVLWNGSLNNTKKICQDGVYVWMMLITDHYGVVTKERGTVTLLGRKQAN